jgi:hypothetical protein
VFWYRYDWKTEVELNLEFIDEVCERYGASPALRGWYLPHETTDSSLRILDINTTLARRLRDVTPDRPILISPFFAGRSDLWNGDDARSRPGSAPRCPRRRRRTCRTGEPTPPWPSSGTECRP